MKESFSRLSLDKTRSSAESLCWTKIGEKFCDGVKNVIKQKRVKMFCVSIRFCKEVKKGVEFGGHTSCLERGRRDERRSFLDDDGTQSRQQSL